MIRKTKLKDFVLPSVFAVLIVSILSLTVMFTYEDTEPVFNDDADFIFTTRSIFDNSMPTIKNEIVLVKPYTLEKVILNKNYYDYLGDKKEQENSIILYDGTYMQNSGIDYICDEVFDINSILDGTVIKIGEDNLLGKYIEIKHSNDIISIYQGLKEINVKQDDVVSQGDIIGISGKNNIEPKNENTLHFELLIKGSFVNPLEYFNKKVQDI